MHHRKFERAVSLFSEVLDVRKFGFRTKSPLPLLRLASETQTCSSRAFSILTNIDSSRSVKRRFGEESKHVNPHEKNEVRQYASIILVCVSLHYKSEAVQAVSTTSTAYLSISLAFPQD